MNKLSSIIRCLKATAIVINAFAPSRLRAFALLPLYLFTFSPLYLFSQNIENTPYIEVNGNAQIEVIPDVINIQIILKEYMEGKSVIGITQQEAKMKNMLKIAGIDISKLTLANVNADYVTITKKNKEVITQKTYMLVVSKVPDITTVFQELSDLNIKDARIISITHSKIDSLRLSVKTKAIQDAKEKAKILVVAIGNKLGKPLIIRENDYYNPYGGEMMFAKRAVGNDMGNDDGIVEDEYILEFKKIKVTSSIYARFGIE